MEIVGPNLMGNLMTLVIPNTHLIELAHFEAIHGNAEARGCALQSRDPSLDRNPIAAIPSEDPRRMEEDTPPPKWMHTCAGVGDDCRNPKRTSP